MHFGFFKLHIHQYILFLFITAIKSFSVNRSDINFEEVLNPSVFATLQDLLHRNDSPVLENGSTKIIDQSNSFSSTVVSPLDSTSTPRFNFFWNHLNKTFDSLEKIPEKWKILFGNRRETETTKPPYHELNPPILYNEDSNKTTWPVVSITVTGIILAISLLFSLLILAIKSFRNFYPLDLSAISTSLHRNSSRATPTAPSASSDTSQISRPSYNRVDSLPTYSEVTVNSNAYKVSEQPPPSYSSLGYS